MPTYDFRDTETGKEFQVDMKISEYDNYLKENPTHQRAWNRFCTKHWANNSQSKFQDSRLA